MHYGVVDVLLVPADPDEPAGPEVVHKTASLPGERDRLLREAELLQAAAERGVGGLATVVAAPSADADDPTLVTTAVLGPSLAVAAPLPVLEVAGVAAEVARLLAGLHEAGLVHGAVEPGHVVLDGAGGLILVGLGDGGDIGGPTPGLPPGEARTQLDPAADVAGWGALVGHLLDWSATTEEEPMVALRRALVARPRRRRGLPTPSRSIDEERRVLAALADQAQEPDPAHRPTARSLAAAVNHRVPGARMPGADTSPVAAPAPPVGLLARLSGHLAAPFPEPARDGQAEGASPPGNGLGAVTPPDEDDGIERSTDPRRRPTRPNTARSRRRSVEARLLQLQQPEPAGAAPVDDSSGRWAPGHPEQSPSRLEGRPRAGRPARAPDARRVRPSHERRGGSPTVKSGGARRLLRVLPSSPPARRWAIAAAFTAVAGMAVLAAAARPSKPPQSAGSQLSSALGGCPAVAPPAADADGDGCEEAVHWVDGVLQAGSARFALGGPGDAWVVGDWDCDGRRTPALLHDGSLAVFDTWPGPGGELQGRQVASAPGSLGLSVVPGQHGCDRAALARPGAADLLVDPRPSP